MTLGMTSAAFPRQADSLLHARRALADFNGAHSQVDMEAALVTLRQVPLQCVAVCCSVLPCVAVCCSVLQCVAVCCSVQMEEALGAFRQVVLYCVASCCIVLQCAIVCCSMLHLGAVQTSRIHSELSVK